MCHWRFFLFQVIIVEVQSVGPVWSCSMFTLKAEGSQIEVFGADTWHRTDSFWSEWTNQISRVHIVHIWFVCDFCSSARGGRQRRDEELPPKLSWREHRIAAIGRTMIHLLNHLTVTKIMFFVVHVRMLITFMVECLHAWPFSAEPCSHWSQIQVTHKHDSEPARLKHHIWLKMSDLRTKAWNWNIASMAFFYSIKWLIHLFGPVVGSRSEITLKVVHILVQVTFWVIREKCESFWGH